MEYLGAILQIRIYLERNVPGLRLPQVSAYSSDARLLRRRFFVRFDCIREREDVMETRRNLRWVALR